MSGVLDFFASLRRAKEGVGKTPAGVVHRENKWRLLRYRERKEGRLHKTPVLLVPSLINRHYVLDLLPGRSFAEFLVQRGFDVFIIDWGTPGDEDRYLDFDTITDKYIGRAIRAACRLGGAEQVHLLGYCLGGTLTAIHTAVRPERVASLIALAAPIGFHDEGLLSLWTRTKSFDVNALVEGFGNVPWPLMQASFEMLKPTLSFVKSIQLVERAWDDQFLDAFWAIETWGHDNVSFPGECYKRYIEELYRADGLLNGTFALSGTPVDLGAIECPTLAITFAHDHIVPHQSASVLLDRVSSTVKEHLHLPGGHVGAVVSRRGAEELWPKIAAWFERTAPAREARGATIHTFSAPTANSR